MRITEIKLTSKIKNAIISWNFVLYVYCLEKDINILKEKNHLFNLIVKHGVSWHGSWDINFDLKKILAIRPTYTSTFVFTFLKKRK